MQKVEAGRLRGRKLMALPRGVDGLRPTAAKVRGAIFDRLATHVRSARVLDLYAGSGALSIEALSRGAARSTLVETNARVAAFLRAQLAALGIAEDAEIVNAEVSAFLERPARPYDLVLIDPPFAAPEVFAPVCDALVQGWLAEDAIVVCERERIRGKSPPVDWPDALELEAARTYGQAVVEFLRFPG